MSKNYASKVVSLAKSQIGYYGKKTNSNLYDFTANKSGKYTKYAYEFDTKYTTFYNGRKNGFDWCDVFVDWVIITSFGEETGRKMIYQPLKSCGAGCGYSAGYYKSAKRFFTYPKVGDQIFFGNATNYTHTGIVVGVDSKYVYTVEGNVSCQVVSKKYDLNNSKIKGYGRPNYDEETNTSDTPQPTNNGGYNKKITWGVVSGKIKTKTVTASALNMRKKVSLSSEVLTQIPNGTKVSIVQENIINNDGYDWDCIIYKDYIGYVVHKYLR